MNDKEIKAPSVDGILTTACDTYFKDRQHDCHCGDKVGFTLQMDMYKSPYCDYIIKAYCNKCEHWCMRKVKKRNVVDKDYMVGVIASLYDLQLLGAKYKNDKS